MDKKQIEELKKLSFEKALAKLETAVSKMENGNLPLEDMMTTFEEGQMLAAICGEKLKTVEKKIEIMKQRRGEDIEWTSFNADESQTRNTPVKRKDFCY